MGVERGGGRVGFGESGLGAGGWGGRGVVWRFGFYVKVRKVSEGFERLFEERGFVRGLFRL